MLKTQLSKKSAARKTNFQLRSLVILWRWDMNLIKKNAFDSAVDDHNFILELLFLFLCSSSAEAAGSTHNSLQSSIIPGPGSVYLQETRA